MVEGGVPFIPWPILIHPPVVDSEIDRDIVHWSFTLAALRSVRHSMMQQRPILYSENYQI